MRDAPFCFFPVLLVTRIEIFLIDSRPVEAGDASRHGACIGGCYSRCLHGARFGGLGHAATHEQGCPPILLVWDAAVGETLGWEITFVGGC